MKEIKGVVINKIQGFYTIKSGEKEYLCKLRGVLKKNDRKENCTVGDFVIFGEDGFITKIEERRNLLIRPLVANIDYGAIQFSAKDPVISYDKLEILILNSFYNRITPIVVVNKIDLLTAEELEEIKSRLEYLSKIKIKVFYISTYKEIGIQELKNYIKDKVTAFGGPSGVGKSTLLNMLQNTKELKTGETSKRLKAGKHTTRDSKLLPLDIGGYIIDTPGFSSVELPPTKNVDELINLFPDFKLSKECKFKNCIHINEPNCAIKEAVEKGEIMKNRYELYKKCYNLSKDEIWNRYK